MKYKIERIKEYIVTCEDSAAKALKFPSWVRD
jgi:hypothetical protein